MPLKLLCSGGITGANHCRSCCFVRSGHGPILNEQKRDNNDNHSDDSEGEGPMTSVKPTKPTSRKGTTGRDSFCFGCLLLFLFFFFAFQLVMAAKASV